MTNITLKIDREKIEAIQAALNLETDRVLQEISEEMLANILKEMDILSFAYHVGPAARLAKPDESD